MSIVGDGGGERRTYHLRAWHRARVVLGRSSSTGSTASERRPAGTRIDIDDEAERGGLTIAVAALLATEVFHIAATVANDSQPTAHHAQVGRPAHVLAVVLTAGLLVWIRRRGAHARTLTGIAGAAVAAAALIYHVLPIDSDYLNPFRDGATTVQWISVVAGVVAGAWCAAVGFRAPKRETPPSSLAT